MMIHIIDERIVCVLCPSPQIRYAAIDLLGSNYNNNVETLPRHTIHPPHQSLNWLFTERQNPHNDQSDHTA